MYIYCMYTIGGRGPLAASVRGCGYLFFFSFSRSPSLLLQKRGAGGIKHVTRTTLRLVRNKKNNNLGVFTENGAGKKKKYRCKCQTNKLNAQLGHFTVFFFSPFIFFHNQQCFFFIFILFFYFFLGVEA